MSTSRQPLRVVLPQADRETIEILLDLLYRAEQGEVVGLAYVALHRGKDYSGDVSGSVKSHPLFTIGVIRALEHLVARHTK